MRSRHHAAQQGLSLVDLMVGLAIGMAAILVTLHVAFSFDARRRFVTGMADAQGNVAFAITLISRELRMAGHGLGPVSAHGCIMRRATGKSDPGIVLRPALIVAGADGMPDTLMLQRGGERSMPAAWLIAPYSVGKSPLQVDTTVGMSGGDYLLLHTEGSADCALLQIAGLGAGSAHTVHLQADAAPLPSIEFSIGSAAVNLGAPRYRRYTVDAQQRLQMDSFHPDYGNWAGATLANGVVNMQLQYGFDARPGMQPLPQVTYWADDLIDADGSGLIDGGDWRRLLALRIAIVTRSTQRHPDGCHAVAPQWIAGAADSGELTPTTIRVDHLRDWRCWRYRVLQAEVPLRNQIWSDD